MTRVSAVRDVLVTSSTLKPTGLGVAGTLLATWVTNSEIKMVDMLKRKKNGECIMSSRAIRGSNVLFLIDFI